MNERMGRQRKNLQKDVSMVIRIYILVVEERGNARARVAALYSPSYKTIQPRKKFFELFFLFAAHKSLEI